MVISKQHVVGPKAGQTTALLSLLDALEM